MAMANLPQVLADLVTTGGLPCAPRPTKRGFVSALTVLRPPSARHPPAVDHQVLPGDEGRFIRGKEERGVGDVFRAAEPGQRRAAVAVAYPARLDGAAALAGEDFAGRHGVADDAVG